MSTSQQSQLSIDEKRKRYIISSQSPSTLNSSIVYSRNPSNGQQLMTARDESNKGMTTILNVSPLTQRIPLKKQSNTSITSNLVRTLTPESVSISKTTEIDPAQVSFSVPQISQFKPIIRQNSSMNASTLISRNQTTQDTQSTNTQRTNSLALGQILMNMNTSQNISTTPYKDKKDDDNSLSIRQKYKALKEENKKLKRLLKQSETIIVNKVCEGKQEQQQTLILYNTIYPIIQALIGLKDLPSNPPSNFQSLIRQLDELQKSVTSGQFANMIKDYQSQILELNVIKKENVFLKNEVKRLELSLQRVDNQLKKTEFEARTKLSSLIKQVRELKAFKKQVSLHFNNELHEQDQLSLRDQTLIQKVSFNQLSTQQIENNHYINDLCQQQPLIPSYLRALINEQLLEEREDKLPQSQLLLQQSEDIQSKDKPVQIANVSCSIPDISSSNEQCLKKQEQQQIVNLNKLKGLQAYQQNIQETVVNMQRRRQDLGDNDEKLSQRKSSFSPSILVRRFLPFLVKKS